MTEAKTDRDLLELAAKAADLKYRLDTLRDGSGSFRILELFEDGHAEWNPLTDDGDALRLAVKLTLEVDVCRTGIAVRTPTGIKVLVDSKEEPDAYAATRRAIVRAAAAIGEAMK